MRYFPDVSHYQKIDWTKFKADAVIQKCTEATTYLDPTYKTARKNWKGIFGSYHFARGGDVIKEADWFLKNAPDADIHILDWEIEHPDPVKWCTQFINRLKEKGKFVWFYTNDARATKYKWPKEWIFWIARYGANTGSQSTKPAFKGWSVWQYTSNGTCPGVTGRVDLNVAEEWAFPPTYDDVTGFIEATLPPEAPQAPTSVLNDPPIPPTYEDLTSTQSQFNQLFSSLWALLKSLFKP